MASIRTTIATAGTLAALGGLTAFAIGAGDAPPEAAQPSPAPAGNIFDTSQRWIVSDGSLRPLRPSRA